ncbi:MAG: hypothetical protein K2Y05_06975 [Hyphomicrobiaceae bacterium]|nr:hypothetical protein [Hyphomicrobiaceae bacterium]
MSSSHTTRSTQPDLFGTQTDLFGPPPKQAYVPYVPPLEKVRAEVNKVLDKARIAKDMPWTAKEVAFWKTVFPQMTNWLPEDEREQVRAAFWEEIGRLEAGLSAKETRGAPEAKRKRRSAAG